MTESARISRYLFGRVAGGCEGRGSEESLEDLLGAGAILASTTGDPSPEARAAIAAFRDAAHRLPEVLSECASGRELIGKGHGADVGYAARLNASATVPVLTDGAFR